MSKGNIIKISSGTMREISTGDYTVYAENINMNAATQILEQSKEGVVFAEPAVPSKEINAKVIVHFRPKAGWKGEDYGFDWMRRGDTKPLLPGDVKAETIIGKYYKYQPFTPANLATDPNAAGAFFNVNDGKGVNEGPFAKFKTVYDKHTIPWKTKKDAKGKPLKNAAGAPVKEEYFVPWLSLFPKSVGIAPKATNYKNTKAVLSLIVEIEEDADSIEFEDNPNFTITPKVITAKGKGIKHLKDAVTIECNKEFSTDQILVVKTIKTGKDGKKKTAVAGKIRVWANTKRKKKSIVLIQVKTSITNVFTPVTGQEAIFKKFLNMALINPVVKTDVIDVSGSNKFKTTYIKGGNIASYYVGGTPPPGYKTMHAYLSALFATKYPGHFLAFYFADNGGYVDAANNIVMLNGYSSGNSVVLFAGKNDETPAHEFLHSLKLPHTFTNKETTAESLYTFKQTSTDNVMDYSHYVNMKRASLFQWQWKIANAAAENE